MYFKAGGTNDDPASVQANEDSICRHCSQTKMVMHISRPIFSNMTHSQIRISLQVVRSKANRRRKALSGGIACLSLFPKILRGGHSRKPDGVKVVILGSKNGHDRRPPSASLFYPMRGIKFDQQSDAYAAHHSETEAVPDSILFIEARAPIFFEKYS